jgi:hypothetical protein
MTADLTAAERKRRQRQRQAGDLPPPQRLLCVASCGRGRSGLYGCLCRRCWEQITLEGRAAKADRVRATRARQRAQRITPNQSRGALL